MVNRRGGGRVRRTMGELTKAEERSCDGTRPPTPSREPRPRSVFRAGSFVMSLWPITGLDPPRPPIDAREIVPFIIARRPGGPQ